MVTKIKKKKQTNPEDSTWRVESSAGIRQGTNIPYMPFRQNLDAFTHLRYLILEVT